ncbi:gas vesicle protein GvpN [Methanoplanus endosymbiosus]|uniref:Gas vesicle protein GvpN n=1 Tax=Methanoplanus endosymbiosus TaxID=33865 RepID=A0A9E7TKV7_9EURY|nr:gas vesicle protein GvpN [Methanoplanus endosymbiosus]UUX93045.1 gas vesicle protein GvpN [Methanoplanus endosymbiosus]
MVSKTTTGKEKVTVINPRQTKGFVHTEAINLLAKRGLRYLNAGYPIHYSGPTGCGKTTLAMHVASLLNRPVILINGDDEYSTSSFIGGEQGYRKHMVVDKFVSRVTKVDESYKKQWVDERLTAACRYGFTLIYNEFTRSRPEANNILLSVLEERVLPIPGMASRTNSSSFLKVHPDFSAIFTSNPEEYAGVYRSQDALIDRMITLDMDYYDKETEIAIVMAKSGQSYHDADIIVKIIRKLRDSDLCEFPPTLRSSIVIAKTTSGVNDESFREVCLDVLSRKIGLDNENGLKPEIVIDDIFNDIFKEEKTVPDLR